MTSFFEETSPYIKHLWRKFSIGQVSLTKSSPSVDYHWRNCLHWSSILEESTPFVKYLGIILTIRQIYKNNRPRFFLSCSKHSTPIIKYLERKSPFDLYLRGISFVCQASWKKHHQFTSILLETFLLFQISWKKHIHLPSILKETTLFLKCFWHIFSSGHVSLKKLLNVSSVLEKEILHCQAFF